MRKVIAVRFVALTVVAAAGITTFITVTAHNNQIAQEQRDATATAHAQATARALAIRIHAYSSSAASSAVPAFPLKVSVNGHYLVDQHGTPFLIKGDSSWAIPYNISTADAKNYLAQRHAQGFNLVYFTVFDNTYGNGRANFTTFDGISPFTRRISGFLDLSMPNPAYFARLDTDVQITAKLDMAVVLVPVEADAYNLGSLPILRANGLIRCFNYGVFLGKHFRSYPNVMWASGVDFETWNDKTSYNGATDDQLVEAVERGIASVAPTQLQTIELNYDHSSSTDDPTQRSLVGLSWVYDQWPQYDYMYREYNRVAVTHTPYYLGEGYYEGGPYPTEREVYSPLMLRKQEYWTALSGATGQMFGNKYTWGMYPGWQQDITTIGAEQFVLMSEFIEGLAWWRFVPDQHHVVMIAGYGTYAPTGTAWLTSNDYAVTARVPDGSLVISYIPTSRPVTYDMARLAGPVTAKWFDPTNGTYTTVKGSPFSNTTPRQFTPPGVNSGGDSDWVFILAASRVPQQGDRALKNK